MTDVQRVLIENIRKYRKKAALSQVKMAELCNVSSNFISEIETGRKYPSVRILQKIIDILNVKPYQLFIESVEAPDYDKIFSKYNEELLKRLMTNLTKNVP